MSHRSLPRLNDWDTYHATWSRRMGDFGFDTSKLTRKVEVHANYEGFFGLPRATWWTRSKCDQYLVNLNARLLEGRVRGMDYCPENFERRGPFATLSALLETDGDSHANCALLTLASLHIRRKRYDPDFVDYERLNKLEETCRSILRSQDIETPWMSQHTHVLFQLSDDYDYILKSAWALPRYLAEEHAANFCQYAAVIFEPVAELAPGMMRAIDDLNATRAAEKAAAEARHQQWLQQREAERAEADAAAAARLAAANERRITAGYEPITALGDWSRISREELERLLWSMPVIYIADQYGVSDVAVHKAAKSRNISKPPAGFWNRVHAGKEAHPQGKPPRH